MAQCWWESETKCAFVKRVDKKLNYHQERFRKLTFGALALHPFALPTPLRMGRAEFDLVSFAAAFQDVTQCSPESYFWESVALYPETRLRRRLNLTLWILISNTHSLLLFWPGDSVGSANSKVVCWNPTLVWVFCCPYLGSVPALGLIPDGIIGDITSQ